MPALLRIEISFPWVVNGLFVPVTCDPNSFHIEATSCSNLLSCPFYNLKFIEALILASNLCF